MTTFLQILESFYYVSNMALLVVAVIGLKQLKISRELSVPGTTSTISTGIAERGLQGLISRKPVPCTLSTKSTTTSL